MEYEQSTPGLLFWIICLAIGIFYIATFWKVFEKAGKPGWASIIPIYNIVVLLDIAGKPVWWIILFFIPIVNFIFAILTYVGLADRFGKGGGFAVGLILLGIIFFPILGFGSAQYRGAVAKAA